MPLPLDHWQRLEHDPEKCEAVFPRDKRVAFARRSCSNNNLKRDDASSQSHRALGAALSRNLTSPRGLTSDSLARSTLELLLVFGIPLAVGFAAGYSLRACISRRRRRLAQQYSLWQKPPDARQ